MSRIRANQITNQSADGAPTVQNGLVISGVCTATSFSGDGSALTGLSGVSVANQADNRLITATGTTDALNGEAGLTWNGTKFGVGTANPNRTLTVLSNGGQIDLHDTDNSTLGIYMNAGNASLYCRGNSTLGDGSMGGVFTVHTHPSGGSIAERFRITSDGKVNIGGDYTQTTYPFSVLGSTGGNNQINIVQRLKYSGNSNQYNTGTVIAFTNTNTNADAYSYIGARIDSGSSGANANALVFATNATNTAPTEKLRIRSDGKVLIGGSATTTSGLLNVKGNVVFDDGTNARITLQADGTSTNQILSTTTNFGSYCNMKYQALDHIFQHGGNEKLRITNAGVTQTGTKTITGGNNLAIQSFAVKGVWSGASAIGKSIELISGYDSAVKMAAIGYNLTDVNLGSTYGGDLTFHTQPVYSSPTTPIPERMRISSSGYITKSVVPSWNLRPYYQSTQTTANTSSHHAIGWTAAATGSASSANFIQNCSLHGSGFTYNIHNGQNSGRLRVPVAGRYFVYCTYRVENQPQQGNIYVYVNSTQIARQHVEMWAHRPYMHCQWQSVLNLARNDEIIISISCPNANVSGVNDNVNWFGGYLIG